MQRSLLLSSFLVVCTTYFVLSAANTMLGGAKEAKIDSHTEDVAKFAVTQLNAKANFPVQGTLKLGRIVSAKTQVGPWPQRPSRHPFLLLCCSAADTPCLLPCCMLPVQVVAGINHILHLETSDDAGAKQVEVTVYEKLPANLKANEAPMELTNSKLVGPVAEVSRGASRPAMARHISPSCCACACICCLCLTTPMLLLLR